MIAACSPRAKGHAVLLSSLSHMACLHPSCLPKTNRLVQYFNQRSAVDHQHLHFTPEFSSVCLPTCLAQLHAAHLVTWLGSVTLALHDALDMTIPQTPGWHAGYHIQPPNLRPHSLCREAGRASADVLHHALEPYQGMSSCHHSSGSQTKCVAAWLVTACIMPDYLWSVYLDDAGSRAFSKAMQHYVWFRSSLLQTKHLTD